MFTFNCKTFCSEAWRVSIKWLRRRIYLSKAGMAVLGNLSYLIIFLIHIFHEIWTQNDYLITFLTFTWKFCSISWLLYINLNNTGLVLAQGLVENGVVDVLMTYLTRELKQKYLPKSAAIINGQAGVDAVFVIIIAHLADACIGRFKMVLLSTAIYIMVSSSMHFNF